MLEQPDYYLAQLDRPRDERPPEWRSSAWVDTVLRSALLEVKERDALAAEVERLGEALESIRCLDPDTDTDEGYGEAGEAVCYHLARDIADAALTQSPGGDHEPA